MLPTTASKSQVSSPWLHRSGPERVECSGAPRHSSPGTPKGEQAGNAPFFQGLWRIAPSDPRPAHHRPVSSAANTARRHAANPMPARGDRPPRADVPACSQGGTIGRPASSTPRPSRVHVDVIQETSIPAKQILRVSRIWPECVFLEFLPRYRFSPYGRAGSLLLRSGYYAPIVVYIKLLLRKSSVSASLLVACGRRCERPRGWKGLLTVPVFRPRRLSSQAMKG